MARMRSITTLTRNHVGLYIKVIDADQTYRGQLTGFEAESTHSPNEHPTSWNIGIDGDPYTVSSAAMWTRQSRLRAKEFIVDTFWENVILAIPRLLIRGIGKLIDAF